MHEGRRPSAGPDGPSLLLVEATPDTERLAGAQGVVAALRQNSARPADRLCGADLVERASTTADREEDFRLGSQACCLIRPLHGAPPHGSSARLPAAHPPQSDPTGSFPGSQM